MRGPIMIEAKIKDNEDSGAKGKALEVAFAACMDLAGMKYVDNGLRGKAGALWDFKPKLGWKGIPNGAPVNLKVSSGRTLFTSTDFWRNVFLQPITTMSDDDIKVFIKSQLDTIGFDKVWWFKPKDKKVESDVIVAAKKKDKNLAKEVLREPNWSYEKLGSYDVTWDIKPETSDLHKINVIKSGKKFATITVRVNTRAKNTAGWARTTKTVPPKPYKPLRESAESVVSTMFSAHDKSFDRDDLPQIPSGSMIDFADWLWDEYQVESDFGTVDPMKIMPIQYPMNWAKVDSLADGGGYKEAPIIVSSDGFILDGHHRWAAAVKVSVETGANVHLSALRVFAGIDDLVTMANLYPRAESRGLYESARGFPSFGEFMLETNRDKFQRSRFSGFKQGFNRKLEDWAKANRITFSHRPAKTTLSHYIDFRQGAKSFTVRISDHPQERCAIEPGCHTIIGVNKTAFDIGKELIGIINTVMLKPGSGFKASPIAIA